MDSPAAASPGTFCWIALAPRIAALGGRILVAPFEVEGIARIALIEDAVGAVLGLWQAPSPGRLGTIRP